MNIELEDYFGNTRLVLGFPKVGETLEEIFVKDVNKNTLDTDFSFADLDTNEDGVNYIRLQYENENDVDFQIDLAAFVSKLLQSLDNYYI
jgi:hypothetical protein